MSDHSNNSVSVRELNYISYCLISHPGAGEGRGILWATPGKEKSQY
jgi:hypothetical protein